MKKIISILICTVLLAALFAGSGLAEGQTIKIGVVTPLTGDSAYIGELIKEGYDYAVDYYNNVYGGVKSLDGAKIELVYADHQGLADVGVTEVERLINVEKCDILCGTASSTVMLAVAPTCEKYGVSMIDDVAASAGIMAHGYKYIFEPNFNSTDTSMALVEAVDLIDSKFGDQVEGDVRTVAIICSNDEYGVTLSNDMKTLFEANNIKVAFFDTWEAGCADFSSMISKLKASGATFVMPCTANFNDAVLLTNQLHEYQCNCCMLATGGIFITEDYLNAVGENATGMITSCGWTPDFLKEGSTGYEIYKTFVDTYGHDMDEYTGVPFINISTIVAALENCTSLDKTEIRDAIYNLHLARGDEPFMALTIYDTITFDQTEESADGETLTQKNVDALIPIVQRIDGAWRMIGPDSALEENPIIWPFG